MLERKVALNNLKIRFQIEDTGIGIATDELSKIFSPGQDCLNRVQEFQPDCILIDLVMPVMDGFEAVRQIRKLPEFKHTIAIGTSASVYEAEKQESLAAGCNAFLSKPIRVREKGLNLRSSYQFNSKSET